MGWGEASGVERGDELAAAVERFLREGTTRRRDEMEDALAAYRDDRPAGLTVTAGIGERLPPRGPFAPGPPEPGGGCTINVSTPEGPSPRWIAEEAYAAGYAAGRRGR